MNSQPPQRFDVDIDVATDLGPLEMWRHGLGIGGINTQPIPDRVVEGTRRLRPRLIRIFIQQFFDVYPETGRFDWSRLDRYLDALDRTGAKIVAAIAIKPGPLFDVIDHAQWRPSDVAEWQEVIRHLVRRYSVERDLISHWEIGNETDIGEAGGSPYLITDPAEYAEFYTFTAAAVREAAPHVKVGGTAACWVTNQPLPGFIAHCAATHVPLDFISWHLYNDDWTRHADGVREGRRMLAQLPAPRPEMMVTEWNKSFDTYSVPDQAVDPRRAALVAASILAMQEENLDWSFYYHLWDQYVDVADFEPFFSAAGLDNMYRHWNEVPHRFGIFSESGQVRPQYFVYQLLGLMTGRRISAKMASHDGDGTDRVHVLSGTSATTISTMLINVALDKDQSWPVLSTLTFNGLRPGECVLTVYRIDQDRRWDDRPVDLRPMETRRVFVRETFECQLLLPADTVSMVTLVASAATNR